MAGWLEKIFNPFKTPDTFENTSRVEPMSGGVPTFTPFSGNAYESDVYRSAIDAIARNAGKLRGKHIIYSKENNQRTQGDDQLNRILNVRPNPYMTAYDMLYKLVSHYYLHNNAFAYLQKDDSGNLRGIYPLSGQSMEYLVDGAGEMYARFLFSSGKQVTFHISELLILRRHFNSNDLLGDNNTAITNTLDLAHTQNEGLQHSIKNSATLRGIIKYNQVLSDDNLKKAKDDFAKDYLNVTNNGGLAALDSKADYIPLENKNTATIDQGQLDAIKTKIYDYLGIGESIVNSTYDENQWAAFYESVIEPLAVQISLELTEKLFTQREQAFGNSIVFESNRLQFASNESKTNMIKELMPLGMLTINQALEILNMPPVDDGHKRLQTLNVVNSEIADKYQLNRNPRNRTNTGEVINHDGTNSGQESHEGVTSSRD